MRIIIVNKYARVIGGSDVHCLELAKGLREHGHEVMFLSTADDRNLEQSGIFVPRTVTNDTRGDIKGTRAAVVAGRAFWNANAAAAMRELIASFRPDIVHAHKLYPQLSVAPIVVASDLGLPIVQTAHDYEFISASPLDDTGCWRDRDEEGFAYRSLNTLLFGSKRLFHSPRVDHWIAVSRYAGYVHGQHGIESSVLPHFTQAVAVNSPQFGDREGILFVGRLSDEKGLRHVLRLPEWLSSDHPIAIAGDGPLVDEVQSATQAFPSLTYLGKLDRAAVVGQLASARIVVIPSLCQEPAGLVALEAMAVGTPLIAYDKGGLAEYVRDAAAGMVVSPSTELLADAITSLYDDRHAWEDFSAAGLEAVQRDHTRSVYLDRLERIYSDLIKRG
ncbi:MAG: glycosyltransferase family 4 protein [Solirubrobacteraceae bacterium]